MENTAIARLIQKLEEEGAKTREQTEALEELGKKNFQREEML